MVRQKKVINIGNSGKSKGASSISTSRVTLKKSPLLILSFWKSIIGTICLAIAVYIGVFEYLKTRVNTPFNDEKIVAQSGLSVPDRYWGSYRPGVYFGLKSRDPTSPVFGLMWYQPTEIQKGIRHWCNQNDELPSYGWIRHDGVNFGEQVIEDPPHWITTSYVKVPEKERGGTWTARIDVQPKKNSTAPIALIWYAALDDALGDIGLNYRLWAESGHIVGTTPPLQRFRITLVPHAGKVLHMSTAEAQVSGLHLLKEKVHSLMQITHSQELGQHMVLVSEDNLLSERKAVNFVVVQLLAEPPFTVDVVFSNDDAHTLLQGDVYTQALHNNVQTFDKEFKDKFHLEDKGYSKENVAIARAAMSNLVGGIGYFYGAGQVQSLYSTDPVPYWNASLYTAVPSRSFFPRGFLWDEGFHGLLIGRWSSEIQMDIAAHWFDLINVEGWIPREQILGVEALARVPKEFVVQSNAAANPPMFLLQIAHAIRSRPQAFSHSSPQRRILERSFTRLQAWYQWFHTTQRGSEPTSFRWRGRTNDGLQLSPKTLTSGLDDYPRASHPSDIERHVDLRCWMYAAADAMVTIANVLQRDGTKYKFTRDQLADEELLNELHWSPESQMYADYGMHTDGVRLIRQPPKPKEPARVVRTITSPPQPRLVTSAFGYVSLFPMLLKVLKPDSLKLGKILQNLDNPALLWSQYGLRSLSKSSPYYMRRNTEHDPPYWRGQVWLNINYLALAALKHYAREGKQYSKRASQLHDALRDNLVRNVLSEYKRTGYLWEQYSGEDGRGSGCRPFTGWTALIVLIMSEDY